LGSLDGLRGRNVPAIRLLVDIKASEPWLPVSVVLCLPVRVLEGIVMKLTNQVRSDLLRDQVDGKGWEPATRIVVSVVLHDAATLLTLLDVVAAEEGPATDKLGLNRAVRVEDGLVEDDPGLTLREDLPGAVIAIITVGDGEGHLASVVTDLIERIDLLDDGTLDHVVIPGLTEVVIVENIVDDLRLQVLEDSLDLDSRDGGVRSGLGEHLKVLLLVIRDNSETLIVVHDVEESLELLISGDVLLTLLELFRSPFTLLLFFCHYVTSVKKLTTHKKTHKHNNK